MSEPAVLTLEASSEEIAERINAQLNAAYEAGLVVWWKFERPEMVFTVGTHDPNVLKGIG